jgi:hypothetical protein
MDGYLLFEHAVFVRKKQNIFCFRLPQQNELAITFKIGNTRQITLEEH